MGLDVSGEVWIGIKMTYGEFWTDAETDTRLCSSCGPKDGDFCDGCGRRTSLDREQIATALMVRLAKSAGNDDPGSAWESMIAHEPDTGDLAMRRLAIACGRPVEILLGRLVCETPSHRIAFPVAAIADDDVKRERALVMAAFKALEIRFDIRLRLYVVADANY